MGPCTWPRGCFEPAEGELCYYHGKVTTGLIAPDWYLLEPHTARPRPERRARLGVVLAEAGASPSIVASATNTVMFPRHYARHGTGFIRTGIAHVRV